MSAPFAFVQYRDSKDGETALAELNGRPIPQEIEADGDVDAEGTAAPPSGPSNNLKIEWARSDPHPRGGRGPPRRRYDDDYGRSRGGYRDYPPPRREYGRYDDRRDFDRYDDRRGPRDYRDDDRRAPRDYRDDYRREDYRSRDDYRRDDYRRDDRDRRDSYRREDRDDRDRREERDDPRERSPRRNSVSGGANDDLVLRDRSRSPRRD